MGKPEGADATTKDASMILLYERCGPGTELCKSILRPLFRTIIIFFFLHSILTFFFLHCQRLYHEIIIGVNTHFRCYLHRLSRHLLCPQLRVVHLRPRRRDRERAPAPDTQDAIVTLQDVAVPRDLERRIFVGNEEARLQPTQILVCAPPLGQLHARPRELTGVLIELPLEPFEEGEGVGGGAREANDSALVVRLILLILLSILCVVIVAANRRRIPFPAHGLGINPSNLPRVGLYDDVPHRDHPVPHHAHAAVLSDADDRRTVPIGRPRGEGGVKGPYERGCRTGELSAHRSSSYFSKGIHIALSRGFNCNARRRGADQG
mmetsp:Transcript_47654/g.101279  ORF Transcript_47654/g.101279 Transcript_47654/m.101279 type:complete len:321 (+) Transcript_47654:132-1094(+)